LLDQIARAIFGIHEPQLSNLDDWIADQGDRPSRPEAIRRLLEHALGAGKRRK
jgi:hypothetical protein